MKIKKKSSAKSSAKKAPAKKSGARKTVAKKSAKPAKKASKKAAVKSSGPAKKASKKAAPKKSPAKKTIVKKAPPAKPVAKKSVKRPSPKAKASESIVGEEMPAIIIEETRIEPVDEDLKEFMRDESEMRIPKSPGKSEDSEEMDDFKMGEDFKIEDEPSDFQDDDED